MACGRLRLQSGAAESCPTNSLHSLLVVLVGTKFRRPRHYAPCSDAARDDMQAFDFQITTCIIKRVTGK